MKDENKELQSTAGPMRLLYFLALIAIVLPPRGSGRIGLVTGSGWPWGALLGILSLCVVALAIWRAVMLWRNRTLLDAPVTTGLLRWCQIVGVWLMGLGVLVAIAQHAAVPITRMLFPRASENGVEFFVVGVSLVFFGGCAAAGLLLHEFCRLVGFERALQGGRPTAIHGAKRTAA